MHKRKLRQRGYNQAEEIAKGIQSRICRTRVVKLLECIKEKPSQTVRSKSGRWSELEGVFKVLDMAGLDRIKHIILVDDVLTTGATLYTCSQEITHKMKTTKISLATMAIAV
jgi:predicted amidophosphoribosyltransferase